MKGTGATAQGKKEFGCSFFQIGNTQGICPKYWKYVLHGYFT